ncbi:MAG TPA: hypothetical protein VFI82_16570 [Terriglobales bacterium]|nr:hypothetical protein [Terriglobales bacterium]
MIRKLLALLTLFALLVPPASAFDTFWHSQASRAVGKEFGFSEDAWKIMQLGCFSPDFFGPISDFANERLQGKDLKNLNQYGNNNLQVRRSAIFLHFDNLNGALTRNSQFDSLFTQLLRNTQDLLANINTRPDLDDRTRKVITLLTLGASLHAVQDFYSHSDWIHNDFNKLPVKMVPLAAGGFRAPTWFEFRDKSGDPDHWPIRVTTGIYPPPAADIPNTHTHMNHDNSGLLYKEYETPGAPVRSEAPYHNAGPVPAHADDPVSVAAHQKLAADTAIAASLEWVRKVEENAGAKAAIERARTWNLKISDPKLAKELQAGLAVQLALSCAAGRWDGEEPPADRGALCRSVLEKKFNPLSASTGAQIESEIIGLAAGLALPWALKFTGKFWDVYSRYQLLDQLTNSIGTESGRYKLQ